MRVATASTDAMVASVHTRRARNRSTLGVSSGRAAATHSGITERTIRKAVNDGRLAYAVDTSPGPWPRQGTVFDQTLRPRGVQDEWLRPILSEGTLDPQPTRPGADWLGRLVPIMIASDLVRVKQERIAADRGQPRQIGAGHFCDQPFGSLIEVASPGIRCTLLHTMPVPVSYSADRATVRHCCQRCAGLRGAVRAVLGGRPTFRLQAVFLLSLDIVDRCCHH